MLRWVLVALALGIAGPVAGADGLRDPTRPPQGRSAPAPAQPAEALRLDFVVSSQDRHLARINGQWVSEGDMVAGARIQHIEVDRVVFSRNGESRILTLGGNGVRKSHTEQ